MINKLNIKTTLTENVVKLEAPKNKRTSSMEPKTMEAYSLEAIIAYMKPPYSTL